MKRSFDKPHEATKELTEPFPGNDVWVSDLKKKGLFEKKLPELRFYLVELESGAQFRRNRSHPNTFTVKLPERRG